MSNLGIVGGTSREEALKALNDARQAVVDAYVLAAQFPKAEAATKANVRIRAVEASLKDTRKEFESKNNWFTLWGSFSDAAAAALNELDGIAAEVRAEVQKTGETPIVNPPAPPEVDTGDGGPAASSVPTWVWWAVGGAAILGLVLWLSSRDSQRVIVLPSRR